MGVESGGGGSKEIQTCTPMDNFKLILNEDSSELNS